MSDGVEANPGTRKTHSTRPNGVQSIGRAFALLETMVDNGGVMGLSKLAEVTGLPLPTIHRLVRTLVDLGYLRQEPSRQYAVAPRLTRLGEGATRMLGSWGRPYLASLVSEIGESANLAMLDGDHVVYVAQVPSKHAMRMFTEVGRRVPLHCTAVGKAMLAQMDEDKARDLVLRAGMAPQTEFTITDPDLFMDQLRLTKRRGYATDEGEQEIAVRCVAVPVVDSHLDLAISISGPAARMTDDLMARAVQSLLIASSAFAADLNS